jgi:hypothetical protein
MKTKYALLSLIFLLAISGCNRENKDLRLTTINLQVQINDWAGGVGILDQKKYLIELERYNKADWFESLFLPVPVEPDQITLVDARQLSIRISSGEEIIYESFIDNHRQPSIAHVAQDMKNVISITNGTEVLGMYEFIGRYNSTIHVNLGPGATFTKW